MIGVTVNRNHGVQGAVVRSMVATPPRPTEGATIIHPPFVASATELMVVTAHSRLFVMAPGPRCV